jgi:ubiquinone/menaquinone biosynthesis C-methylase UbiE
MQFDLVTPTFLLQNASTEERFETMVRNIYSLCKPGGRVAGMGSSPMIPPEKLDLGKKYGRTYELDDDYFKKNGARYVIRIIDDDLEVDIKLVLYWHSAEHYEQIFRKVGFTNFRWIEMKVEGFHGNEEYWKDFIEYNTLIMYEAFKPK